MSSRAQGQAPDLLREELEWVARIRAGDAAAFERVFRTYHPGLCTFAYRYVRSRDVAQELVQDVFAKLWEDRQRLSLRDCFKNYLYTAVRNRAISHLRHDVVERRCIADPSEHHDSDGGNEGELRLEAEELEAVVERVLRQLPERCRVALALRWQRHMTYAEVAEAMGISVKTVEIHIGRGLAALREAYRGLLRS